MKRLSVRSLGRGSVQEPVSRRWSGLLLALALIVVSSDSSVQAEIFRWDTTQVIPGTEGILPAPGVVLNGMDLSYAQLDNERLESAQLNDAKLENARLAGSNLSNASLRRSMASQIDLTGVVMVDADLSDATLNQAVLVGAYLTRATLQNTDLTDAIITDSFFADVTSRGLTKEQFYTTASYRHRNVTGVTLSFNDLSGWDFSGVNLTRSNLGLSNLEHTNLSRANLTAAALGSLATTTDLTDATILGANFKLAPDMIYKTASYKSKDLRYTWQTGANLAGIDLQGVDLSHASLDRVQFINANLKGANLANALVYQAEFQNSDLTGAIIRRAFLRESTITVEQIYSTKSYQDKDLSGIIFYGHDLTGMDLRGQNLVNVDFERTNLSNAQLQDAKLANANLTGANLTNANLTGAVYSRWTLFPAGFDPTAAQMVLQDTVAGDFNADGQLDQEDVDRLANRGRTRKAFDPNFFLPMLDLDQDQQGPDQADLALWAKSLKGTYFGDANLDGHFDSLDMVNVFQAGQYQDAIDDNSGWATGDWNADGDFTSEDFVVAFQDGGYELTASPTAAVPEPRTLVPIALWAAAVAMMKCHPRRLQESREMPTRGQIDLTPRTPSSKA